MRVQTSAPLLAGLLTLAACGVEVKHGGAGDSAAADSTRSTAATSTATGDSATGATGATTPATTAGAGDSAARADSAALELWPARPRRGGVLWARLKDTGDSPPRCSWNGTAIPCHTDEGDALVVVPLPADAAAGIFALEIEAGGHRVTRSIKVDDHDFGRELVFLDARTYALTQDASAIARDARAVRTVLAGESAERRWGGTAWREPKGGKTTAYGVERFYYRASDSARAISIASGARTTGTFGTDTTTAAKGGVPSWRHAGVDIAMARGARVEAPAAGTVADVGQYQLTGRTLLLDHGQGVFSAYFHLDSVLVRRGDVVRAGQAVARVGATGLATGPHLHYGIYVHGRDVDPVLWRQMPPWLAAGADSARKAARRGG